MVMVRTLSLVCALACGCCAGVDAARATLTTTAYATVQADRLFADAYEVYSDNARATSSTQAEKDLKMVDWDAAAEKVEPLISDLYAGLAIAELALDAIENSDGPPPGTGPGLGGENFDETIACLAVKLREVAKVLDERRLKIPAALAKVLALSEGLTCAGGL